MKAPICSVCLQSNILCRSCEKNAASGHIGHDSIAIIKKLYEMSKKIESLSHASIEKVFCHGNLAVIVVPKADVPNVIGRGGRIIDEVKKCSGKQAKVVGREDRKTMITRLMFPARLAGVGSLYSNGVESIKISIKKSELKKLPASKDDLVHAVSEISGMGVSFAVV